MDLSNLRDALLKFFGQHRRDLPWRQTRDPYSIWVSEVMLQQTQVDTVIPRYQRFLDEFPTVHALAAASETRVCEAWAGLGYYRRARYLHAASRVVLERHDGLVPPDVTQLRALPGVGRYTAGAIASMAFGQSTPVVDGNVERVLSRLFALDAPPKSSAGQRELWAIAEALVQGDTPGDLNQALMELGSLVCTPKSPQCNRCPVSTWCQAYANGEPERYPTPNAKPKRQALHIAFAWLQNAEGTWLCQRGLEGLWPGLWELPSASGSHAKRTLENLLKVRLKLTPVKVTHQLSHRDVTAVVYVPQRREVFAPNAAWKLYRDPATAPLHALARKALVAIDHAFGPS